jgi:exodeoxyribonuclease VII large subunit
MAEKQNRQIHTVSSLTRRIKSILEENFAFVWIIGEISNHAIPASGHSYFTLKDQDVVINAVMFKNQKRALKFDPENGMKIMGLARLTLYEPRGTYQLVFEHLEPAGAGALQIGFEQLKARLAKKGFFDEQYKKKLPVLPLKIAVITSGTGAALKDIIKVCQRRFPNCRLEIIPVQVQGDAAPAQISEALETANKTDDCDLIILARGGGSLEDLSAFNTEIVARAIFDSAIPVITGIGHETDFTIADFVADLRAPTPSAAAEIAVPDKNHLIRHINELEDRLTLGFRAQLKHFARKVQQLASGLKRPDALIYERRLRLEDYESRLRNLMTVHISGARERLAKYKARLAALDPVSVLKRGYSIVRAAEDGRIITDAQGLRPGDSLEIILARGQVTTKVEKING